MRDMGYLKTIENNLSRIRTELKEHGWILSSTITGKSVEFLKEGETRCVYIYLGKDTVYIRPYSIYFKYDNYDRPCELNYWEASTFAEYAMWFATFYSKPIEKRQGDTSEDSVE